MVCAEEAAGEIAEVVGAKAAVTAPTWADHLYSCGYRYSKGTMVLSVKELSYVEAAGALGATGARVMTRHVAPQCVAPFLIITTGHLGAAIFIEAALSFVGVGVPPPTPSWGNMLGGVLAEAFKPPWWMVVFPGTAITITILAVNLFGDALRDFLDPKLQ